MKRILIIIAILFSINGIYAQSMSAGKVIYAISYPESSLDEQTLAMMPTEATMYFNDDKTRMEMQMGMGMNMVTIADNKTKSATVLMDMMGNKTAMTMTEDDINKEAKNAGEYEIKKTEETKTIAGYLCKKAVVTLKNKNSFNVWYTDQIRVKNSNWNNQFKNIDGFLMEFRMDQNNGLSMLMTAKKITDVKPGDELFVVPGDYKKMTKEEMMKMYGGKDK